MPPLPLKPTPYTRPRVPKSLDRKLLLRALGAVIRAEGYIFNRARYARAIEHDDRYVCRALSNPQVIIKYNSLLARTHQ